ncbi:UNVERIFIED_CONTAM: Rho GDP-dissociation inhibitor 1 [Sesamum calycinum]|uniref:Rho GDP-dissociation inhibitor 1 n=1 Tax=Sesamum calycinum TaxID=2727403 RepID=A0AAW2Q5A8_9LAMI
MGSDGNKEDMKDSDSATNSAAAAKDDATSDFEGSASRQPSEANSCYTTEDEVEEVQVQLGPKRTIKEHLETDKDDESLRRWKEQLLEVWMLMPFKNRFGQTKQSEVIYFDRKTRLNFDLIRSTNVYIIENCGTICRGSRTRCKNTEPNNPVPGRSDIELPIPEGGNPKGLWFTLKEGSRYRLRFSFKVSNDIVCGLKYTNTVWKAGLKVDSAKEMLGTFSPQVEPYIHEMAEETTPSGMFARGSYSAKSKFIDDDNKCYLEINYTFDIQKEWATQ